MIKRVIDTRLKAIVVLPYISIVTEKVLFLKRVVERVEPRVNVTACHGGARIQLGWKETDISVCTIEKAGQTIH